MSYVVGARTYYLTPDDEVAGEVDIDEMSSRFGRSFQVKGMFFGRCLERLGDAGYQRVRAKLVRPPLANRYLPFNSYPQADYIRLLSEAARIAFPSLGLREATRRLAREDFDVFAATTFGQIMLSGTHTARDALHKVPFVYSKVAPGDWIITALDLSESAVRVQFVDYPGGWEYSVGQFEGIVRYFGKEPYIVVHDLGARTVQLDVWHTGRPSKPPQLPIQ